MNERMRLFGPVEGCDHGAVMCCVQCINETEELIPQSELAAANRRIAEPEAQIETQGRNCQHYADMTLKLESELAKAREIITELCDRWTDEDEQERVIEKAEKWMEGK